VVWRIEVERSEFLAERASGAEAQGLCSRSPVVAGGRVLSWEKLIASAWRFEVFGARFSENRRASGEYSVIASRNCIPGVIVLIVRRSFNDKFPPLGADRDPARSAACFKIDSDDGLKSSHSLPLS
jgi:hypothetical protein